MHICAFSWNKKTWLTARMHRIDSVKIVVLCWCDMGATQTVQCTSVLYVCCFGITTLPVLWTNLRSCALYLCFCYYYQHQIDWLRARRSGIESRWGRDFLPVQTGPEAHPASCKMGTGPFPGVKCGRGVLLTTHPLLVPRSTHPLGHIGL
jgi:hypothetical protein